VLANLDMVKMQVTFVGHKGFAPDGPRIYYIATDTFNQDVAKELGAIFIKKTEATNLSGA
jgi:hypothetical protein